MHISRRDLLRYGFAVSAATSVGLVGLAAQKSKLITPIPPLKSLSAKEYSILHAISNRLLPASVDFPSIEDTDLLTKIDLVLFKAHPGLANEIKLLLMLIENGAVGLVFDGTSTPFTHCTPEEQDARLNSWKNSSIPVRRTAFKALNGLCAGTYYSDPKTFSAIGYGGPPQGILSSLSSFDSTSYEDYLSQTWGEKL